MPKKKQPPAIPMPGTDTPGPPQNVPPVRRRGGPELPDSIQDRPEQNAGYDEAVQRGPGETQSELGLDDLEPSPESQHLVEDE